MDRVELNDMRMDFWMEVFLLHLRLENGGSVVEASKAADLALDSFDSKFKSRP